MTDPSASSGSTLSPVEGADRRSRGAASILALVAGATAWLSAGTVGFTGGGAERVAALPSFTFLIVAMVAAVAVATVVRLRLDEAWPLAVSYLLWLPFVPGSTPAVFMLWQGPVEAVVWAVALAGVIYARARPAPAMFRDPRIAPWIAAVLAVVLSTWAFTQVRSVVPGGDEPHYLVATQSLLADRDLKVENNYAVGSYLDYFAGRLQPHFLQRSSGGEIYSIHSPGVSVAVLPAFAIGGYAGAVALVILIAGLTAALTWTIAWRVSQSAAGAWAGVAAVWATAPFVFQTFTIYPDGIGALMVMTAVWLIVRLDGQWEPSPRVLVVVGASLSALPWLHTRFAILAALFGVVVTIRLAARPGAIPRLAAFLAIPALAALGWFAYFWAIWGTPSPLAPYGRDTESSLSYIWRGVTGLLVDQQFGVLSTAPVYAIALIGLVTVLRRRPRFTLELLLTMAVYATAVATYAMWWGGTSAPARFIAAILPLAAIAIACAWSIAWLRPVTLLLLLVSTALILPRILVEDGRFVFTSRSVVDATIEWLNPHVDLAMALPSVHRDGAGVALRDATLWALAVVFLCADAFVIGRMRAGRAAAWAMCAFSGAVLVMGGTWIAWSWHGSPGNTRDRSALALLSTYRPWHTLTVDAKRWQSIPQDELLRRTSFEVPADNRAALLRASRVPAGDYLIENLQPAPAGTVAVLVGRADPLLDSTKEPSLVLNLPVAARSLSVRADSDAPDGALAMRLRPTRVGEAGDGTGRSAIRAARYGRARVFVFDERAYLEPGGFWTRAEGSATVVMDADEDARRTGLTLAFTAGAAATTVGISVGEWSQSHSMTPGERRTVVLPPLHDATAWVLNIHSGPGFRPFERDAGSTDVRSLAVWFEIP